MRKGKYCFAMGDDAMTEGAIAAGANFYAGYPITPSSEVAESSSIRLPQEGGTYIQCEDEISSMAAIIGSSLAGGKAYTATSGPGFSLMQENLGLAVQCEVPCVVIDVQRVGPSMGMATKPAQGDVMQARWGTHSDHGIIALSPSSVQDCYDLMIQAFNLAERFRTPVVVLADEAIGHLRESYYKWVPEEGDIINRKKPTCSPEEYFVHDYESYEDGIAPFAAWGSEYVTRMTSINHGKDGILDRDPKNIEKLVHHLTEKYERNIQDITITRSYEMEDAEYIIITFGCSTRPGLAAMHQARELGLKVGLLQLVTIWPFAAKEVEAALSQAKAVYVPEMNLGQVRSEIEKINLHRVPVYGINKVQGRIITPAEILDMIRRTIK